MTTVYFAGNEDSHFQYVNCNISNGGYNNSSAFLRGPGDIYRTRSGFANAPSRYGFSLGAQSSAPPSLGSVSGLSAQQELMAFFAGQNYIRCQLASPAPSFWCGARIWTGGGPNYNYSCLWRALDPDGNVRLFIAGAAASPTGPSGPFGIFKVSAAGAITQLCAGGLSATGFSTYPAGPDKFDVELVYSTTGTVTLYANRQPHCSFSGDVTTDGNTEISTVDLGTISWQNGVETCWSEVAVLDINTPTLGLSVYSRPPTGPGSQDQWTGNYASVSGSLATQGLTSNNAPSAGLTQLYTVDNTLIDGGQQVVAVVDPLYVSQGPASAGQPTHYLAARQISGTVYLGPSTSFPPILTNQLTVWLTNPATGAPWTPADLNSSGYQIGIQSAA